MSVLVLKIRVWVNCESNIDYNFLLYNSLLKNIQQLEVNYYNFLTKSLNL
jgi:hypothetical protein